MKKILRIIVLSIVIILIPSLVYCVSESFIKEDQEELGITDFIEKSEDYTNNFFEELEIEEIFNESITGKVDNTKLLYRIIELLGPELLDALKTIGSVVIIVVIHSVLKAISDSLENSSISRMIYYVQYILIVTIIMMNFTDIIKMVEETTESLVGFMNLLIPLLITLMLYTGNIVTSSVIEPTILVGINIVGNIINTIILPLVLILVSFIIISKLSDRVQIEGIVKTLKSGIIWFLCIVLTIFVGVVSFEGTLASSIDGITSKTSKSIVSTTIPVVGKILGDVVDVVLGSGIILKNAIGFVGVIIILSITIIPIIKLGILSITYSLAGTILEPIADKKITGLLNQVGDVFKILLAILSTIAFLLIIGTALVLKLSNSGMMYG